MFRSAVQRQARIAVAAAALTITVLSGAACGGKHPSPLPSNGATGADVAVVSTPAAAALVSATQLAGGWSAASAAPADFGAARCDGQLLLLETGAAAEAAFSKGEGGPWGVERLARA